MTTLLFWKFPRNYLFPQKHPYDAFSMFKNNFNEFFGVKKGGFKWNYVCELDKFEIKLFTQEVLLDSYYILTRCIEHDKCMSLGAKLTLEVVLSQVHHIWWHIRPVWFWRRSRRRLFGVPQELHNLAHFSQAWSVKGKLTVSEVLNCWKSFYLKKEEPV